MHLFHINMSLLKSSTPLLQAVRQIGTTELRQCNQSPKFLKLRAKQEKFQTTMGLSLVAIGMCVKLFYELSFPKRS
ncbi:hypothetical protein B566_EDAN006240 [Ephemera danica]|nr:hypothetical protein B566_EDAN006240 [Ephemera danica]